MVVIDPAHGGADAGARGSSGIQEKDVVLYYALLLRDYLQRQGLRVVLTRQAGENPGFDDRAAMANSYRDAVFITLHASSTGPPGAARCYYDAGPGHHGDASSPSGLLRWERAQEPFAPASQRLAGLVQALLHQSLPGSPATPVPAPVRQLRTVAAPAIAVEVSSVSVPSRDRLDRLAQPLAESLARALAAFRGGGA